MQKYFIFGLMAILAACSSDKGGGLNDGYMQYIPGGFSTGMKTVSHAERTKYLADKIDGKRDQETNKTAFDNMYSVLLGNGASSADADQLLDAIKVAGKTYDGTDTDETTIRKWITEKESELQAAARETYMKYGLFLTDIDFKVSNSTVATQPMHFTLDGTKISGVQIDGTTYTYNNGLFRTAPNASDGISVMTGIGSTELQYSNFGRIAYGDIVQAQGNNRGNQIDSKTAKYATYYGGYENLKVAKPSDGKFTGGVIGIVYGKDGAALRTGGSAEFDAGAETLTAYFGNWYTMAVGADKTLTFTKAASSIDDNYTLNSLTGTANTFVAEYYGENGVASEVVGSVDYTETGSGIHLDAAFGGKK